MAQNGMSNRYPVFIPSKGRWESRFTIKAFDRVGFTNYKVVVEPQQYDFYASVIDSDKIIVLPHTDKGLVATRNWIWDYAESLGVEKFWTFDDNIKAFWRWNKNSKVELDGYSFLSVIEDFVDRYENVPIAGMNYYMFIKSRYPDTPIRMNTRVYSNMLIDTFAKTPDGIPYRNEGFYNDDTDLCLRMLKDGFCTILFNAFLIEKSVTMTVGGGMTPHYQDDGRYKMALELFRKHPDVTKITRKWGRWQHHVDYRLFKANKLIRKPGIEIPQGVNNYGMKLVRLDKPNAGID